MSNPAVFKLNKTFIRDNVLQIEDNIGESIHFHIGLVRFDLTIDEFNNLADTFIDVLNTQVNIENFDLLKQNEYFLERIAPVIPYIVDVKEVNVKVNEMKYRYQTNEGIREDYIINTPVYKYYMGEHSIIDEYVFDKEIWQSKEELLEQVKNNRNSVIYVDENNFILDGYKSICAGIAFSDIGEEIKVKQITFSKNKNIECVLIREIEKWWLLR